MLIKNLVLCPPWDGIKTHILSAQGFHRATCSPPFAPVCRLSSFFFSSPCNTVFNRGKQRTCCLRDNGAGLSSARLSPRWALLLWSPGKMRTLKLLVFKDLLMQQRGFHLGSSTWMKTKVSSGVRRNLPLGPQRYLYMWDHAASSPFFNLCRSSRRVGGGVWHDARRSKVACLTPGRAHPETVVLAD